MASHDNHIHLQLTDTRPAPPPPVESVESTGQSWHMQRPSFDTPGPHEYELLADMTVAGALARRFRERLRAILNA